MKRDLVCIKDIVSGEGMIFSKKVMFGRIFVEHQILSY